MGSPDGFPLSAGLFPLLCGAFSVAPDVDHDAHFCQQQHQAGAAGREERQTDTGIGDGVGDDRNVAEHLPRDLRHDADAHHRAVQIFRAVCNDQSLHDEYHEQNDNDHRADEAQLLAYHTEDKVVVAFRQPELFFHAVAKASAGQPAGADGVQALQGLILHFRVAQPAVQTALQVFDVEHFCNDLRQIQQRFQCRRTCDDADPWKNAAAAGEQQNAADDRCGQDRGRHMRLSDQQQRHRNERQHRVQKLLTEPDAEPVLRGQVLALFQLRAFCPCRNTGAQQDQLKFCQLGGLQCDAEHPDPAPAAVQRCKSQGNRQQSQHDPVGRLCRPAQKAVVHKAHDVHDGEARSRIEQLHSDVVQAAAHAQIAGGVAGAVQHHKAENNDNAQRCQPFDHQLRPRAGVPLEHRGDASSFFMSGGHLPSIPLFRASVSAHKAHGQQQPACAQDAHTVK